MSPVINGWWRDYKIKLKAFEERHYLNDNSELNVSSTTDRFKYSQSRIPVQANALSL